MPAGPPPSIKGHLPLTYRWFRANGMKRLMPWVFSDDQEGIDAWRTEYWLEVDGSDDLLPFAFQAGTDWMAGFLIRDGQILDRVETVYLSWAGKPDFFWLPEGEIPPRLDPNTLPSFLDWLTATMIPASLEMMDERRLHLLLTGEWKGAS